MIIINWISIKGILGRCNLDDHSRAVKSKAENKMKSIGECFECSFRLKNISQIYQNMSMDIFKKKKYKICFSDQNRDIILHNISGSLVCAKIHVHVLGN